MTRKFVIAATLGLLLLGAVMWHMGLRDRSELQAVATEQFNRQQLILAQKVAQDITQHFDFLRTSLLELTNLGLKYPALVQGPEQAFPPFVELLRTSEVLAIGHAPPGSDRVTLYNEHGPITTPQALEYVGFIHWARQTPDSQGVLTAGCESPVTGPFAGRTILRMAARQRSADVLPELAGVIFLVVDAQAVARRYAHDVRSGQTGYAWVLDQRGIFLDHYVESFIGMDAEFARKNRDPSVDFSRIDAIMRDFIRKGREGVDWYVSGWHRGSTGEVRKLIAYAPARVAKDAQGMETWGVAVVAPVEEVEGIIGQATMREMLMVAAFQVVVFVGLIITGYFGLRWSANLKVEVDSRTAQLSDARDRMQRNLEELLRTQELLIRSERFAAIGEAAAHISHEIKNPLMLMAGFARQVRRTLPEDGKEAQKLLLIEEEAKRLETMLDEVRDFTRPSAPKSAPHDLNETARDTIALMEAELAGRKVSIVNRLSGEPLIAPHDPSQIRQVILNLVKNAAEAMPQGGAVTLETRRAGNTAELEVRDTGPGLTPDQAKQVFNPFYTTKERGTGLGLSVCFRILRDHKGDIRLASEPGRGCAFTISLPVAAGEPDAGAA